MMAEQVEKTLHQNAQKSLVEATQDSIFLFTFFVRKNVTQGINGDGMELVDCA